MNESSNNSYYAMCEAAYFLSQHGWLKVVNCARITMSIVGIILFAVLFRIQGTHLALHINARCLLISHHIWTILQCLTNLGGQTFDLVHSHLDREDDHCAYLVSTRDAVIVRGPHVFTQYGQMLALAAMAIERSFATITYKTYETANCLLGITIVILQWLIASLYFWLVIKDLNWSEMKPFATVSSSGTSTLFANLLISLAGVEVIALGDFYALLHYNRRRKEKSDFSALTERYQLDENIRSTSLMIPMIWTHFFCFIPTMVIFPVYIHFFNPTLTPDAYIIFTSTFNFIPFYAVVLPIVLFWRHETLRKSLKTVIGKNNRILPAPIDRNDGRTEEQIVHFEALRIMWTPKVYDSEIKSSRKRQPIEDNIHSISASFA